MLEKYLIKKKTKININNRIKNIYEKFLYYKEGNKRFITSKIDYYKDNQISDMLTEPDFYPFVVADYQPNDNINELRETDKTHIEHVNIYKEIKIFDNDLNIKKHFNTHYFYLELDSVISNFDKRYRHFVYKKFVPQFKKDDIEHYKKLISKPVATKENTFDEILISPVAFLNILSVKFDLYSQTDLDLLINAGFKQACLELTSLEGFNTLEISDLQKFAILHELYNITETNNSFISFYNSVEYPEYLVFNTKVSITFSNESIYLTKRYEYVELNGIIYKIPWVIYKSRKLNNEE